MFFKEVYDMGIKMSTNSVKVNWAEVTMSAPKSCFRSVPSRDIDGCADARAWLIEHGNRDGVYVPVTVMPAYSSLSKDKHGFHFISCLADFTYDKNLVKEASAKDVWANLFIEIVKDLMYMFGESTATIYFHDHIKTSAVFLAMEEEI